MPARPCARFCLYWCLYWCLSCLYWCLLVSCLSAVPAFAVRREYPLYLRRDLGVVPMGGDAIHSILSFVVLSKKVPDSSRRVGERETCSILRATVNPPSSTLARTALPGLSGRQGGRQYGRGSANVGACTGHVKAIFTLAGRRLTFG